MQRNLALELVRVTEAAALAAARENGRGDEMAPERVATEAIFKAFGAMEVQGEIVVGDPQQHEGDLLATGPAWARAAKRSISRSIRSKAL